MQRDEGRWQPPSPPPPGATSDAPTRTLGRRVRGHTALPARGADLDSRMARVHHRPRHREPADSSERSSHAAPSQPVACPSESMQPSRVTPTKPAPASTAGHAIRTDGADGVSSRALYTSVADVPPAVPRDLYEDAHVEGAPATKGRADPPQRAAWSRPEPLSPAVAAHIQPAAIGTTARCPRQDAGAAEPAPPGEAASADAGVAATGERHTNARSARLCELLRAHAGSPMMFEGSLLVDTHSSDDRIAVPDTLSAWVPDIRAYLRDDAREMVREQQRRLRLHHDALQRSHDWQRRPKPDAGACLASDELWRHWHAHHSLMGPDGEHLSALWVTMRVDPSPAAPAAPTARLQILSSYSERWLTPSLTPPWPPQPPLGASPPAYRHSPPPADTPPLVVIDPPAALCHMGLTPQDVRGSFLRSDGRTFQAADVRWGPWRSYLLLMSGGASVDEDDVLFPNAAYHGGRVVRNVGPSKYLVDFLADPATSGISRHLENLTRGEPEAARPPPSTKFVIDCLAARWGTEALHRVCALHDLLQSI